MRQPPLSVPFVLAALLASPLPAQGGSAFDYGSEARALLEASGQPAAGLTFRGFLDGPAFLRVELGSFDVRMPVLALEDKLLVDRLQSASEMLVRLQRVWHAWLGTEHDGADLDADWVTLEKWVKSWSATKLARCEGGERSLLEQLGAKDDVRAAAERLSAATRYPAETVSRVGDKNLVVLAPTRELQVRIAATGGLLHPSHQATLWHPSMVGQGAAWFDWTQIVGLENTGAVDWARPYAGVDYNELDKSGLAQHVSDRGGIILLRKEFCLQGTHFFEESLATNLVIEAVGQNGVRSEDWDIKHKKAGGSTQPYTRFVPGAGPPGGKLPPRKAQGGPTNFTRSAAEVSLYRSNLGEGFFVEPVRKGQKEGAKLARKDKGNPLNKDKRAHFKLYSLEAHTATHVTAPFLGRIAVEKELPGNEYLDDYEDFFRAYRSCFVEWLRTRAAGSEEESAARFAELIEKHAAREPGVELDDMVLAIYGVPLSAADDTTGSLEWRYLGWLQKGK